MEPNTYEETSQNNIFLKVNRFQVEQNAVFIDFSEPQIKESIEHYKSQSIYQRISLSKNIPAVEQVLKGHSLFHHFLLQLAADCEQTKYELVRYLKQQLPKITSQTDLQHGFIEPLIKMINSSHLEIREESCVLLTEITHKLNGNERKQVIKLALQLEKHEDEESKIISINIISKMTPDMTQQQAQIFFKNDYLNIYKQSSVRVKRQIIHSIGTIAKSVRKEFLNKEILDNFVLQRCKEPVWGIRKSCVEILPQLVVLTQSRKEQLANALLHLTKDGNKIVKISAHKILPEFLANYNSQNAPQKLINMYIHLMDSEVNSLMNREGEMAIKVAYYFPGVMMTLGASKWEIMKKLFTRLIMTKNNDVKMPIASSLHEISRIIGPQLSKQYMFSALDIILKEPSDAIKLAAISHISEFVELFEQTIRQNLIDVFLVLQKDPKKWRIRYQIANQLNTLSKIYETETVFKYIFPISLKLCNDNVNEVRFKAAKQMFYVIDNMKQSVAYQDMAIESIKGYALSQKYIQRETFAWMIPNLYQVRQFSQQFIQLINQLARDPIVIVRISLAISIAQIIKKDPDAINMFGRSVQMLSQDIEDVRQYFM